MKKGQGPPKLAKPEGLDKRRLDRSIANIHSQEAKLCNKFLNTGDPSINSG
jgi:hypothetical protein